eukprot:jgi/Chrpa1/1922/Chrysochromulina_OHIO_Genome00018996-RA
MLPAGVRMVKELHCLQSLPSSEVPAPAPETMLAPESEATRASRPIASLVACNASSGTPWP